MVFCRTSTWCSSLLDWSPSSKDGSAVWWLEKCRCWFLVVGVWQASCSTPGRSIRNRITTDISQHYKAGSVTSTFVEKKLWKALGYEVRKDVYSPGNLVLEEPALTDAHKAGRTSTQAWSVWSLPVSNTTHHCNYNSLSISLSSGWEAECSSSALWSQTHQTRGLWEQICF